MARVYAERHVMAKQIHVTHNKETGRWQTRDAGSKDVNSSHRTKDLAVERAVRDAKQTRSEVFIHNKDGKISDRDSYGNDPRSVKDRVH